MKRRMIFELAMGICLLWANIVAADLTSGLVAYYPFNGNADDATSNHNNGTVVGATLTQDRFGNLNRAYHFNGTDNYIQVPFQPYLDRDQTLGFTVSVWFKFANNDPGGYVDLLDKCHGVPPWNYMNWALQFAPISGGIRTQSFGGGNGSSWLPAAQVDVPMDGQWHHLAGTLLAQTFKIYLDGILADTFTFEGPVVDGTGDLFFGRHGTLGRYYQGDIGEIRIYQRALSNSEIRQLAGLTGASPSLLLLFED